MHLLHNKNKRHHKNIKPIVICLKNLNTEGLFSKEIWLKKQVQTFIGHQVRVFGLYYIKIICITTTLII